MEITRYGDACLLVEEAGARLLVDPGIYSTGFEPLRDVTAVLITHAHADHVDVPRVAELLASNPDAVLVADEESAAKLRDAGLEPRVAAPGDQLDLGGVDVAVLGGSHAAVHPDAPSSGNLAYLIAGRVLHPGDSFLIPEQPVEVLAVPIAGPWVKLGEAIDYVRAVAPRLAIGIHDSSLTRTAAHVKNLTELVGSATDFTLPPVGEPVRV